ncbi:MAG TPA: SurA N-terminal domain-containing protein [Candidatus Methylomirabilis sp.]|nr:SurA N-terminal domain-containing protein [Candidatus Methylomirabilis sp.]
MLRTMRHNIKYLSITLWVVIASFIATIFLVWGMQSAGPGSGRDAAVAATVNGERISRLEFQRAYQQETEGLRRLYGDRWNEDLARELKLPYRVLDGLITSRLLLQEAERHGLSVSREELAAVVMEDPLFAEEGKFRPERYRRLLEANRLTPERYEEAIRQGLLQQKLATLIQASAKVSDAEAWEAFRTAKEKVRVAYVSLPRSAENRTRLEELQGRVGQQGTPWETLLQNSGLKVKRPESFAFGAAVVEPPDSRAFHLAVLRLKTGEWSPVVEGDKSHFLIRLLDRETVTRQAFEREKETWTQKLLSEKRQQLWAAWVHEVKRRSKIDVAQEFG